jgi:lipopolysaccharide transport system ATP-binding protein
LNPAIRIAGVSKRYQLGQLDPAEGSFREMLIRLAKSPARRLRRLSGHAGEAESFWALNGVSFEVQPGEVTAVIGRNGAGKSTLLKVLSRITEPTAGRIELRGRVASLLEVGTGFHPDLTGRENVYLNGAILGMRRAEIRRKFDDIIEFAEVAKFVDTAVKHYSSGMYLRLAFAVAAHLDGEILLVDEVLAVGDVAFQRKCLGKMQDVSRGGRSVVFVTHNMMAATSLCHSGVLIDGGQVRQRGPIQDVIKTYLSEIAPSEGHAWDVRSVKRTHDYGDLLTFTRVEALPRDREGFRYGEALRFRLHVAAQATIAPIFAGAGLDDIFGHRLATFESNEVNFSMDVEAGRSYVFDLRIPQPCLNPGRYFLSISLFSGQQYFDLVMHAAEFEISPIHVDTGDYFSPIAGAGALRLPYEWSQGTPAPLDQAPMIAGRDA